MPTSSAFSPDNKSFNFSSIIFELLSISRLNDGVPFLYESTRSLPITSFPSTTLVSTFFFNSSKIFFILSVEQETS